jgi:hypothetical protein
MNPLKIVAAVLLFALVLWLAYRLGQIVLRIVAGLLFMALAGAIVWYVFIR